MAVTDISEVRKKRQAKRTKNLIIRIFIVLLVCGAALIAAFTKDMWLPQITGVLTSIPDNVSSDKNASELAEGRFPIKVEGGMGYQLMNMDNAIALLDDSQFHIYGNDGKLMSEKQHTFANPILCVSGSKALIYDEGGKDFSLESKYKNIYSKTTDDVIYLAKLSNNDYAAVVTKSDKFLAMLKIYDQRGDDVFTYYSYDSRIINVTFTGSGNGCIVTVLTAEGGQLMSKMIRFDFTDTEPKWVSPAVPTLALDVRFGDDGSIIMVGDTECAGFSSEGELISEYVYTDPIKDYDSSGNITAVLTENTDIRRCELIMITGSDCDSHMIIDLGETSGKVFTDGREAYILCSGGIDVYNDQGVKCGEITLEDDYDDLCKNGKYIYLLGYDTINRIDFDG